MISAAEFAREAIEIIKAGRASAAVSAVKGEARGWNKAGLALRDLAAKHGIELGTVTTPTGEAKGAI